MLWTYLFNRVVGIGTCAATVHGTAVAFMNATGHGGNFEIFAYICTELSVGVPGGPSPPRCSVLPGCRMIRFQTGRKFQLRLPAARRPDRHHASRDGRRASICNMAEQTGTGSGCTIPWSSAWTAALWLQMQRRSREGMHLL